METLAQNLTSLMDAQRLSSAELARKTGIAQPVIYRIMNGQTPNPQLLTIKPLADYLGVSIDKLAGFTPLTARDALDREQLHKLNNKLTMMSTIGSTLIDIMPKLEMAYRVASAAKLVEEELPEEMLPLIQLNITNLVKSIDTVREIIGMNEEKKA